MDRGRKAEPRGNKLLHAAELQARQAAHERMLRNAKPSVQNSAPKGFGAVRTRLGYTLYHPLPNSPPPPSSSCLPSLPPTPFF